MLLKLQSTTSFRIGNETTASRTKFNRRTGQIGPGCVGSNHRQVALLTHALRHPGEAYAISGHRHTHGIVYQTARADLLELCELGLLNKARSGKAFVFIAPMDLQGRVAGLVKAE